MRKIIAFTLFTVMFFSVCCFGREKSENFERGGVSFDFQQISNQRFMQNEKAVYENYVSNGSFNETFQHNQAYRSWSSNVHIHSRNLELLNTIKELKAGIVFRVLNAETGNCAYIKTPLEMEKVCGENISCVAASWRQIIRLPDNNGGRYALRFRYKGNFFGNFGSRCLAALVFRDALGNPPRMGKETAPCRVITCPKLPKDWDTFFSEFEVPANTVFLELILRLDGTGETFFTDVTITKDMQHMPLSISLSTMGFLDNTFCLSQGDPAVMAFTWKRNIPKEQFKLTAPMLCVDLPEAVQLKAVRNGLKLISAEGETIGDKKYRRYQIDLSSVRERPGLIDGYEAYLVHSMLVFTSDEAGTVLGDGYCQVIDKGIPVTEKKSFHLKIIPPVKITGKSPSIFMNGFFVGGPYMNFPGRENKDLLGQFIGNSGGAWIVGSFDSEMIDIYRRNGIKMITPSLFYIANGYCIGENKNKPESAKFKPIAKTVSFDVLRGTCPVAIYKRSEYFKTVVIPYLEKTLKGTDGVWANWEPYMFSGMGCFCDNCCNEFIKYTGLPSGDVKKAWPQEMTIGKKYYELCTKFRNYQMTELVKTINKEIDSVTTGKGGIIPGISHITFTDSKKGRDFCREHDPLYYASGLKYVSPWGPYPRWESQQPYFYSKGANLLTFIVAKKVRTFIDENFHDPMLRPRLVACPTGLQCDFWLTQPEAIAMDTLSFFLNRFDAALVYTFPRGYDNRYWAVFSATSRLIAEYEKYVFSGTRFDDVAVTPLTPYPDPVKKVEPGIFPELLDTPVLQQIGYKLNEKYLVAIGNFWEKGDVFFKLAISGLDKNTRYIVSQPDMKRYFSSDKSDSFSGVELAEGILLHAGALRWVFFVIEPLTPSTDPGKKISQSEVTNEIARHLKQISIAAYKEKEQDRKEKIKDRSPDLKPLGNGKIFCTPFTVSDDEQVLKITDGESEILISLNGMSIKKWKINQCDLLQNHDKMGSGIPAFWTPSFVPLSEYQIKKLEAVDFGLVITAEYQVDIKEEPSLKNLIVCQQIEINNDCSSLKIRTELRNGNSPETGAKAMTVGLRYHNLPLCIGNGGSIIMKNGNKEVVFSRKFEKMLFSMKPSVTSAAITKMFKVATPEIKIDKPSALLKDKDLSIKMDLAPADIFAGWVSWDQPSQLTPSFEPFFDLVTIKAGESASFEMFLHLGK